MKLNGPPGCHERIQDDRLVQAAIRIRDGLPNHWSRLTRVVYFRVTTNPIIPFDDEDLHDWETDLGERGIMSTMKVTRELAIIGLASAKRPPPVEDFSSGFEIITKTEALVSGQKYMIEVFGPERDARSL